MKITIEFSGNSLGDAFDICQEIADQTFEGCEIENVPFNKWETKPKVTVQYDPEDDDGEERECSSPHLENAADEWRWHNDGKSIIELVNEIKDKSDEILGEK